MGHDVYHDEGFCRRAYCLIVNGFTLYVVSLWSSLPGHIFKQIGSGGLEQKLARTSHDHLHFPRSRRYPNFRRELDEIEIDRPPDRLQSHVQDTA